MNEDEPFRIRIQKVDKDEFTAYPWVELEGGEIVKRYDVGEAHFGRFEDVYGSPEEALISDAEPADPLPWMRQWHNFGTQAQHPRAEVLHPYLDRILTGATGMVLTGALRGLVAPAAFVGSIDALHVGSYGENIDSFPLVVRYRIGDVQESYDWRERDPVSDLIHPTVRSIIAETMAVSEEWNLSNRVGFDRFQIVGMFENVPECQIEVSRETAAEIEWDTYDLENLPADASVHTTRA